MMTLLALLVWISLTKERLEAVKLLINYTGPMKQSHVMVVDDISNSSPSSEDRS